MPEEIRGGDLPDIEIPVTIMYTNSPMKRNSLADRRTMQER
jgi:hypothetical protein